jgi:hypothetical protein
LARDPTLGDTAAESAAMVGEYRSILQESIFDAGGDTSAATKLAAQRFKRVYGTSVFTMSGDGVVTRLPPEKTYPPGPDGTFAYIGQQVKAALAAEGVKADDVFLKADDLTDADVRAGRPPRYEVFYRQNGNLERYMLPFYAVTPAKADVAPDLSQNRANRDDNLRFMQEERDRNRNMNIFTRADPMSAMVDLTGKRESGRLILGDLRPFNANEYIRNDDGSYSTERSVTIQDGKQWVNVPSLWRTQNGYVDFGNDDGAVRSAMRAFEKRSGDTFQRFDSLKEAERAAEARSKAGGAASE